MNFDIKKMWPYVLGAFLVVIAGVGSAWLISGKMMVGGSNPSTLGTKIISGEVGILDSNIKYANAVGVLKEGGIGNEGTHHLERDGGPSQTVYLTSSVIDLQGYVGEKIEIWGETISSKKAGWLMDVAKIKIIK